MCVCVFSFLVFVSFVEWVLGHAFASLVGYTKSVYSNGRCTEYCTSCSNRACMSGSTCTSDSTCNLWERYRALGSVLSGKACGVSG